MNVSPSAPRVRVLIAFLTIYLVWGSTYLAIRFGVETIPPLLMAGTRFLLAGGILYGIARARGATRPTSLHWRSAAIIGGLMLLVGNGGVSWSEQVIPSGIAALLISTSPFWFVILDWLSFKGPKPDGKTVVGLIIGLVGVVVLIGPGELLVGEGLHLAGVLVLLVSTVSWTVGSLYSRRATLPESPFLTTAMEMLTGGAMLCFFGIVSGELSRVHPALISVRSLIALGYLVVFGSLLAFTSYVWLLRVSSPARVSTYAFVNPVIAVFLGWALGGEELTGRIAVAAAFIVLSVVFIVVRPRTRGA